MVDFLNSIDAHKIDNIYLTVFSKILEERFYDRNDLIFFLLARDHVILYLKELKGLKSTPVMMKAQSFTISQCLSMIKNIIKIYSADHIEIFFIEEFFKGLGAFGGNSAQRERTPNKLQFNCYGMDGTIKTQAFVGIMAQTYKKLKMNGMIVQGMIERIEEKERSRSKSRENLLEKSKNLVTKNKGKKKIGKIRNFDNVVQMEYEQQEKKRLDALESDLQQDLEDIDRKISKRSNEKNKLMMKMKKNGRATDLTILEGLDSKVNYTQSSKNSNALLPNSIRSGSSKNNTLDSSKFKKPDVFSNLPKLSKKEMESYFKDSFMTKKITVTVQKKKKRDIPKPEQPKSKSPKRPQKKPLKTKNPKIPHNFQSKTVISELGSIKLKPVSMTDSESHMHMEPKMRKFDEFDQFCKEYNKSNPEEQETYSAYSDSQEFENLDQTILVGYNSNIKKTASLTQFIQIEEEQFQDEVIFNTEADQRRGEKELESVVNFMKKSQESDATGRFCYDVGVFESEKMEVMVDTRMEEEMERRIMLSAEKHRLGRESEELVVADKVYDYSLKESLRNREGSEQLGTVELIEEVEAFGEARERETSPVVKAQERTEDTYDCHHTSYESDRSLVQGTRAIRETIRNKMSKVLENITDVSEESEESYKNQQNYDEKAPDTYNCSYSSSKKDMSELKTIPTIKTKKSNSIYGENIPATFNPYQEHSVFEKTNKHQALNTRKSADQFPTCPQNTFPNFQELQIEETNRQKFSQKPKIDKLNLGPIAQSQKSLSSVLKTGNDERVFSIFDKMTLQSTRRDYPRHNFSRDFESKEMSKRDIENIEILIDGEYETNSKMSSDRAKDFERVDMFSKNDNFYDVNNKENISLESSVYELNSIESGRNRSGLFKRGKRRPVLMDRSDSDNNRFLSSLPESPYKLNSLDGSLPGIDEEYCERMIARNLQKLSSGHKDQKFFDF